VIAYSLTDTTWVVLRVIHTVRDWPAEQFPPKQTKVLWFFLSRKNFFFEKKEAKNFCAFRRD
jgi:hypothetical protein